MGGSWVLQESHEPNDTHLCTTSMPPEKVIQIMIQPSTPQPAHSMCRLIPIGLFAAVILAATPSQAQRPGEVMIPASYVVPGRVLPQGVCLEQVREVPGKEVIGFYGMRRRVPNRQNRDPETYSNPAVANPNKDPLEAINYGGYAINKAINVGIEQPVIAGYRTVFPAPVRKSVRNFVSNIGTPVSVVNQVAQGKTNSAGVESTRFLVNSTFGVLGIFDVAKDVHGIQPTPREDFGQTLGKYGVPAGPPLDVPVLGQSNPRDVTGFVTDYFISPEVTPGSHNEGFGPAVGILSRIAVLDAAGPTAAYPAPNRGETPYSARRSQAIKKRNSAIAR